MTELRQADFAAGTYRIRESGCYRLMEDIAFNPNPAPDGTSPNSLVDGRPYWMPTASQISGGAGAEYPVLDDGPYNLGFFAAITVETSKVTIDLNGKTLQQSPEHALQQRFFALIEAGSAPFPVGIGPGNFGASFKAASELLVKNGALGLSSHHGIHGNTDERGINGVVERCHKIALYDVTASNFEVAGLHLNGCDDVRVAMTTVGPTRRDVPERGTYA